MEKTMEEKALKLQETLVAFTEDNYAEKAGFLAILLPSGDDACNFVSNLPPEFACVMLRDMADRMERVTKIHDLPEDATVQ